MPTMITLRSENRMQNRFSRHPGLWRGVMTSAVILCLAVLTTGCRTTRTRSYDDGSPHVEYSYRVDDRGKEIKHGLCTVWRRNGSKLSETVFNNGVADGRQAFWFPNGQKWFECSMKNDKRHGTYREWQRDGTLFATTEYHFGKKNGMHTEYHPNGRKAFACTYHDHERHGTCTRWHANGQKAWEGTFEHGKKHGLFATWDTTGTEQSRVRYEHGTVVEKPATVATSKQQS